jgi:DNA-binding CsgD family transcriptional regulator
MLVSRLPGAGDPNKPGVSGPDSDGVILDIEVEGVRCLLIRAKDSSTVTHTWLSPRELEIARMVSKGHPNKLIAAMLDISSWTVSTYLRRIFAKFAVTSRAAMVAKLHEQGLLGELHANPKGTLPAMTAVAEMGSGVVPVSSASLR